MNELHGTQNQRIPSGNDTTPRAHRIYDPDTTPRPLRPYPPPPQQSSSFCPNHTTHPSTSSTRFASRRGHGGFRTLTPMPGDAAAQARYDREIAFVNAGIAADARRCDVTPRTLPGLPANTRLFHGAQPRTYPPEESLTESGLRGMNLRGSGRHNIQTQTQQGINTSSNISQPNSPPRQTTQRSVESRRPVENRQASQNVGQYGTPSRHSQGNLSSHFRNTS